MDRHLVISSDCHAGLPPERYRDYVDPQFREIFDVALPIPVKALPSCEPDRALDTDPLLVRLEWRHEHRQVHRLDAGELLLRESPFDPVADVPLRRLVCLEHEEGTTESSGRVLRAIPGEWLLPFLHQRYDDPTTQGIEI